MAAAISCMRALPGEAFSNALVWTAPYSTANRPATITNNSVELIEASLRVSQRRVSRPFKAVEFQISRPGSLMAGALLEWRASLLTGGKVPRIAHARNGWRIDSA